LAIEAGVIKKGGITFLALHTIVLIKRTLDFEKERDECARGRVAGRNQKGKRNTP